MNMIIEKLKNTEITLPRADTPLWVFGCIGWRFALQGLKLGALYGMGYGALYGLCLALIAGFLYGIIFGLVIGIFMGAMLGMAGGFVLGMFSAIWGWVQGGVMSERHRENLGGYRRGMVGLAVVTTVLGALLLFPGEVRDSTPSFWNGDPVRYVTLDIIPSLIAGFASYQAARTLIDWYEMCVGLPRTLINFDPDLPKGVWPPPPRKPEA